MKIKATFWMRLWVLFILQRNNFPNLRNGKEPARMQKIHLDTDLGGDIDDLCALAMLLRWSGDVQLTGITTVAEANGRRAGYLHYVLGLEGRNDIPVAAGADVSQGFYRYPELTYPDETRYWPEPMVP